MSSLIASRVANFRPSVFALYTGLAAKANAVNLGQGFPDFNPPAFARQAAIDAFSGSYGNHQYARMMGLPYLVETLAQHYTHRNQFQQTLSAMENICVTTGATEAGFASVQAIVNPGDKVVLFEPFYDAYPAWTHMAGATPLYVPLEPHTINGNNSDNNAQSDDDNHERSSDDFTYDRTAFEAAMSDPATRLVILNNPHNPLGKVWRRSELAHIAETAQRHNVAILSDEVYEKLIFEEEAPNSHISIASLSQDAFDRTLTIGSAGKTFSATGWKVGWAIGSAQMISALSMIHQWIPFCVSSGLQRATAKSIELSETNGYFDELRATMRTRRDLLMGGLTAAHLTPFKPHAGYFVMAQTHSLDSQIDSFQSDDNLLRDEKVCRYLTETVRVGPIPPSPFYSDPHKHLASHFARFAFCKSEESIVEASKRLSESLSHK